MMFPLWKSGPYQNIIALINMDDSGAAYTTIYSMGGVKIYPVNNIVIYK